MKKQLLLAMVIGIGGGLFAQNNQTAPKPIKVSPTVKNTNVSYNSLKHATEKVVAGNNNGSTGTINTDNNGSVQNKTSNTNTYTQTKVGGSTYDLQANSTAPQRIVANSDGTVSVIWTISTDPSTSRPVSYADRGTGYAYYNGTSWSAQPTARLESSRTGFPTIGVLGSDTEVVISHTADSKMSLLKRKRGTGAWKITSILKTDSVLWPRMAIGGPNDNSIHLIGTYTGGAGPVVYKGITNAVLYYRSLNGGLTWDIQKLIIPQIDATSYTSFDGEAYAIHARGSNIAIVTGNPGGDVVLLKSSDNGTNWTKTIVDKFPIPKFSAATMTTDTNNDAVADTLPSNDGSVDVLLDLNSKAHVFWGTERVYCSDPGTGTTQGLYIRLYESYGLIHWNEATDKKDTTGYIELNANGIWDFPTNTTSFAAGTYLFRIISQPSAGIDANGNIYLAFSSVVDGSDNGSSKAFRHTYVKRTDDGGANWYQPLDIVDADGSGTFNEGVFASMARRVDANCAHVAFQMDPNVGTALSGTDAAPSDQPNVGKTSSTYYVCIPPADLKISIGISQKEGKNNSIKIYPNPANTSATLLFNTTKPETASIFVFNAIGQEVASFNSELRNTGINNVVLNIENYPKGIYFVNAFVGGKQFTQKLVVE